MKYDKDKLLSCVQTGTMMMFSQIELDEPDLIRLPDLESFENVPAQ